MVKPHGVSDKPLGVAILHGSEGMRMTGDILRFDEGSSGGVLKNTLQWRLRWEPQQTYLSTETWGLRTTSSGIEHPESQHKRHLPPELRISCVGGKSYHTVFSMGIQEKTSAKSHCIRDPKFHWNRHEDDRIRHIRVYPSVVNDFLPCDLIQIVVGLRNAIGGEGMCYLSIGM